MVKAVARYGWILLLLGFAACGGTDNSPPAEPQCHNLRCDDGYVLWFPWRVWPPGSYHIFGTADDVAFECFAAVPSEMSLVKDCSVDGIKLSVQGGIVRAESNAIQNIWFVGMFPASVSITIDSTAEEPQTAGFYPTYAAMSVDGVECEPRCVVGTDTMELP